VPTKQLGKKHGKGIVKLSDGFVSVAGKRVAQGCFNHSRIVKTWAALEANGDRNASVLNLGAVFIRNPV
jgi:hypothetical protein